MCRASCTTAHYHAAVPSFRVCVVVSCRSRVCSPFSRVRGTLSSLKRPGRRGVVATPILKMERTVCTTMRLSFTTSSSVGHEKVQSYTLGVNPKGGRAKGDPLAGCVWRFNAKRKMHLQGPRPWWWVAGRCLCRRGFVGWCKLLIV